MLFTTSDYNGMWFLGIILGLTKRAKLLVEMEMGSKFKQTGASVLDTCLGAVFMTGH